jgi:hypothetical protein
MVRTLAIVAIALLVFAIIVAARKRDQARAIAPTSADHIFSGPGSVAFQIEPEVKTAPNTFVWPATYSANGHTAKFKIELVLPSASKDKNQIALGEGSFLAVAGADPATFLPALQKALEAKSLPKSVHHVDTLPFTYAILGSDQTRDSYGGFSSKPAGSWISMKIFLGSEEPDAGELFLNMDPSHGQAEFSIKDPDYGDIVLRHLATIL